MTEGVFEKRYGLQPAQAFRIIPLADQDLTEERREWYRQAENRYRLTQKYNKLRESLVRLLDDKIFVAESLRFVTSKITGIEVNSVTPKLEYEDTDSELPLSQKIKNIKVRKKDATLTKSVDIKSLRMLNETLISRNLASLKEPPEPDTPEILYRAFRDGAHTRHDRMLGFRCFRQPITMPYYHTGTLLSSQLVDQRDLRNHCEGCNPSDLIALSDSPSRILKFITNWDFRDRGGDRIAVINVQKLLAMGVLFNRTSTLAKSLGMELWTPIQPTGLQYANENYWIAYRWIPAECIERYISISSLEMACKNNTIGA
ncbi:hypothetical protein SI65_05704 [Aspergillus cristatus]|uniref:DUF7587 domain-containing protein n=1 Tax=Aspergillus cristatus TaxID=573508 RepID=A0A1E3BDT0_ASPCR|nr:hypothetical protein SI65_05704 [Aspergillus cristatus]